MSNNKRKSGSKIPRGSNPRQDEGTPPGNVDRAAPTPQDQGATYQTETTTSDRAAGVEDVDDKEPPARKVNVGPVTRSRSRASSTTSANEVQDQLVPRLPGAHDNEPKGRTTPRAPTPLLQEPRRPHARINEKSGEAGSRESNEGRRRDHAHVNERTHRGEEATEGRRDDPLGIIPVRTHPLSEPPPENSHIDDSHDLDELYYDPNDPEDILYPEGRADDVDPADSASRAARYNRAQPPELARSLNEQRCTQRKERTINVLPTVEEQDDFSTYRPSPSIAHLIQSRQVSALEVLQEALSSGHRNLISVRDEVEAMRAR
ncbi:hypothetical protein BDW22DRAFT_1433189 [Trametopsis cervina]|nr:hypothetical protein BDW22DRAFT_1433189 [Trametopsis cervina]